MNTADAINRLRALKSQSMALRTQGDLAGAINHLRTGVEIGRVALFSDSDACVSVGKRGIELELADCLGMLGGNLLRHGDVRGAIEVFQQGRDMEMNRTHQLGLTYCTVNLLVTRLLDRGWTSLGDSGSDRDEVVKLLRAQTASHATGDVWAWADLGMCEFLSGCLDASQRAYDKARALADTRERCSLRDRLLMIRDKCMGVPAAAREFLDSVSAQLT